MKKVVIVFCAIVSIISSCRHNDTSIELRDTDRYFTMKARFDPGKARKVEHYLENNLDGYVSFRNNKVDMVAIDDQNKFYFRKHGGHVNIKLDKYRNSREAYFKVRSICEGMKDILTE